jgi:hypothetical protein
MLPTLFLGEEVANRINRVGAGEEANGMHRVRRKPGTEESIGMGGIPPRNTNYRGITVPCRKKTANFSENTTLRVP